jgi:nicotinate-nucleotide adenylyltransferase
MPDNPVRDTARVGIFGGTFDPLHIAHLAVAASAHRALGLEKVLFVVANRPWQKLLESSVTPAADRFDMVAAAVADDDRFEASDLEVRRGGDSYTVDTLSELAAAHPGSELFLIVGSDLLPDLETWERHEEVRSLARLAVIRRPGTLDAEPPPGWSYEDVPAPPIELSSSDLRATIAAGGSVDYLVPRGAAQVIDERGLYRPSLGLP